VLRLFRVASTKPTKVLATRMTSTLARIRLDNVLLRLIPGLLRAD
jgi:hypothetical protein